MTIKITTKRYKCNRCGAISKESTNHYGEIYSPCVACSWKHPLEATVKTCIEPKPKDAWVPKPWKIVKLGDIAKIN